jgi:hypothetical protein
MPQRRRSKKLLGNLDDQQFVSVLNKTKWDRLFEELRCANLPLDFKRKDINEPGVIDDRWDGDIFHVFGGCEAIEWLDIRAKLQVDRGKLLPPEMRDFTAELVASVKRAKVPFSLTDEGIRVWGYVRAGSNVEWA